MEEKFIVTGMTCAACSARVEKAVAGMPEVSEVTVNLLTNSMRVKYDDSRISASDIEKAVKAAGYGAKSESAHIQEKTGDKEKSDEINEEERSLKKRWIISIIFLIPLMFISMVPMFFHMAGIPMPGWMHNYLMGKENLLVTAFAEFLLLIPIVGVNKKYYVNGIRNLIHLSPNMDSLIAIGSGAATIYGIFVIFVTSYGFGHNDMALVDRYSDSLYLESAATIVTLITLGKYLEAKSKGKTSEAVRKLMKLAPDTVTVIRNNDTVKISASQVVKGDIVLVHPGESIPVDGYVIEGSSSVDESAITGESIPVMKNPSDKVTSATINGNAVLKIKADRVGKETTISQIVELVEKASESKAPIAKIADKVAGVFVPVVIGIAVLAFVIWIICGQSVEFAFNIAISVLVISCPCALGLATPVAIMAGTGKGAENGILIKSGEALQAAYDIDTIVLDKTGTITEGKPVLTDAVIIGNAETDSNKKELLSIIYGIETYSEHPLADAVINYCKDNNIKPREVSGHKAEAGKGISAESDDNKYFAGNPVYIEENCKEYNKYKEEITLEIGKLTEDGKTPIIVADLNRIYGIIGVADIEKETSREAVELFKKMHLKVIMLTGDNKGTAEAIRKRVGIDEVIAEVLPQDKESHIRRLKEAGHKVAMVGDGINDSPALVTSDFGIAIGAGTDVAIDSADAVLMKNDLRDVAGAIILSRKVIANIKENLFWAFFYNCIGIPIACGLLYPAFNILLNPMIGSAAMSLSSVCVVTNALRIRHLKLKNYNEKKENKKMFGKKEEKTYNVGIEGMMCMNCHRHATEALKAMKGVVEVEVSLENKNAIVKTNKIIDAKEFEKAIDAVGYKCTGVTEV